MLVTLIALALTNAKLGTKEFMICGGVSTAVTDMLLFPLDTIKVTQQSSKVFMTSRQALKEIFKNGGGLSSLYKGALGYATMDGTFTPCYPSPLISYLVLQSQKNLT